MDVALVARTGIPIDKSEYLVLRGDGYGSETEARSAGERFRDALTVALSRIHVGADFGERAAKSGFTEQGLKWLETQSGARMLNDEHGLMTFESVPPPRFVELKMDAAFGRSGAKFEEAFRLAAKRADPVSEKARVAFDVYAASFFATRPDARLLLLMMALETLLQPQPRDAPTRAHLDQLIRATTESISLPPSEKESLRNALRQLMNESIRRAGQRLVADRLRGRAYMELEPAAFFQRCYALRSRLVHGGVPPPTRAETDLHAAHLEGMVGDLLSGPLLDLVEL